MSNLSPAKPSEFDDETFADIALIASGEAGLEFPTSSDLFGEPPRPNEPLILSKWGVDSTEDAAEGRPASVTFRFTYSVPHIHLGKAYLRGGILDEAPLFAEPTLKTKTGIPLYTQKVKVLLCEQEEALQHLPDEHHEGDNLLALKTNPEGQKVIRIANESPFPEKTVYMRIYAQNTPQIIEPERKKSIILIGNFIYDEEFSRLRIHSNIAEIYKAQGYVSGAEEMAFSSAKNISHSSGRSGAYTFLVSFINPNTKKEFHCVLSIVSGEKAKKVMEHAVACQQKLEEKGLPVARIYRPATPIYYEALQLCYSFQSFERGQHFHFDERHLEKLGKALADIHNIPVNEMPEAEEIHGLPKEVLMMDIFAGIEALRNREENPPIFANDAEMIYSMKRQLLSGLSPEELRHTQGREICNELGLSASEIIRINEKTKRMKQRDEGLIKGTCWGDMHLPNLLGDEEGNITLLDFQQCGEGVLADELALTTYFLLAGEDGHFSASRTRAFFTPYCKGREQQGRPGPLTQEEIIAILEKVHDLCERQAHPIWIMMRDKPAIYEEFSRRHKGLHEQIEGYMENGRVTVEGANRFAEEFLGRKLASFPRIADMPHAERLRLNTSTRNTGIHLSRSGA